MTDAGTTPVADLPTTIPAREADALARMTVDDVLATIERESATHRIEGDGDGE
jgi:hypothetical protein